MGKVASIKAPEANIVQMDRFAIFIFSPFLPLFIDMMKKNDESIASLQEAPSSVNMKLKNRNDVSNTV